MQRRGTGFITRPLWINGTMLELGTDPSNHEGSGGLYYGGRLSKKGLTFEFEPPGDSPGYGKMFRKGAVLIGGFEIALMATMMMMPSSVTGWHDDFIKDGMHNIGDAYSKAPTWDEDHWYHNYLGHPYAGSIYYNTVRCQGASPLQSFFFSATMSIWWEYGVEAVAEHPSTQDLLVTPITGAILGEAVHHMTVSMLENGASLGQKILIFILNPTHVVLVGF